MSRKQNFQHGGILLDFVIQDCAQTGQKVLLFGNGNSDPFDFGISSHTAETISFNVENLFHAILQKILLNITYYTIQDEYHMRDKTWNFKLAINFNFALN